MKKTLTTLLILTLVASVCGVMFASASDPVEELKTELEALVGAEANADFEWAMDVTTNEDGTVTVVLTVEGIEGKAVNYVYGDLYYNEDELTLLTEKDEKGLAIDCLTSAPVGFDNLTVMKPGVKGAIELNICNPENHTPLKDGDLVLTLTFKLAKGVTLAGLYIPTASVEGAANVDAVTEFLDLNGNGAYGIAYLEVKEESSEPTDETTVPGESSATPSTPDDSSEETSVPGESSTTPSTPDDSSEETSVPGESSTTPSVPDDSSEEPDESSTTPSEPDDSSEETSEPDESSTTPSEPDDSSEETSEPDESSTTPSEPDDSSEETSEPDESSTTPSEPDDSSEETSEPDESSTTPSEPDDSSEETSDPAESSTTPAESSTTPAESSATSSETSEDGPGDSGVLLFMVLGLLAVAGAAVAIKVRG